MDQIETWHDAPEFERMDAKIKTLEVELKTAKIKIAALNKLIQIHQTAPCKCQIKQ
jgi:hypothetical protein